MPIGPLDIPSKYGLEGEKVWIQYRILTMRWRPMPPTMEVPYPSPKEGLRQLVHIPGAKIEEVDLADFTGGHHNDRTKARAFSIGKTPWDIDIEESYESPNYNRKRILVIHLDTKFEWEFKKGTRGVTSKTPVNGEDGGLHYVDPGTGFGIPMPDDGLPMGCSMIYWSLLGRAGRTSPETGAKVRGFNFHIDLINPDTRRRMPTIFDPNIPDNGGATIP